MSHQQVESYLVVGGSGFVGDAIVTALLARGEPNVAIFDISHPPVEGKVRVFIGDITDEETVSSAVRECAATCIIHSASPFPGLEPAIYWKVNVEGTKTLLAVAAKSGVSKFVFTSSAGVVYTGKPISGVDESAPIPAKGYDAYHETKAKAEMLVLGANGKDGLRTVAIRPSGCFGPRSQFIHSIARMAENRQTHVQMGDNTNYTDQVYVDNVAYAHLLAADKLDSEEVAGQAFFITNNKPMLFYDYLRLAWKELGVVEDRKVIKIPRALAMLMARVFETWGRLTGKKPSLTVYAVLVATNPLWYNIDKARRVLGYEPLVTIEDGVARMAEWWKNQSQEKFDLKQKSEST